MKSAQKFWSSGIYIQQLVFEEKDINVISFCSIISFLPPHHHKLKYTLLSTASTLGFYFPASAFDSPSHNSLPSTRPNYFWVPRHTISCHFFMCLHVLPPPPGTSLFLQNHTFLPRLFGKDSVSVKTQCHFLENTLPY